MSGIVGLYHFDKTTVNAEDVRLMVDTIAHRGPDGSDVWVEGSMGLGHRMLWTTPESLVENLPLTKAGLTITADARIDNRDELILLLGLSARPAETLTDSDIILAAYEKWGSQCPEKLLGDFAFAIWNSASQTLFCARDHFGVKPFYYYYQSGEIFAIASEIKALLCLDQVPQQLDPIRIGDYLTLAMEDKAITTYKAILRLPPAHSMEVSESGTKTQRYWQLDPHKEILLDSDEAYAQAFRKVFTESVKCRLRSALPIGAQLSGGLDSSSVTCVARNLLLESGQNSLHTISTIFDEVSECDERPFINAVLAQGGLTPHYIHGDQTSPLAHIETIFQYEDEAYIGPNHFYPWIANKAANELGLRVVLDGFDGDTTVSHGTTRLMELAHQGRWKTLVKEAEAIAALHKIEPYPIVRHYALPYLHRLIMQGRWIAFSKTVQLLHTRFGQSRKLIAIDFGIKPIWRRCRHDSHTSDEIAPPTWINPTFADRVNLKERTQAFSLPTAPTATLRQEHLLGLNQGIFAYTLEQVDRYAASFSLEVRHPFMDKRIIEFCLALPAEQKLSNGFGRMIMRRALAGILPEAVQWRFDKADLSANFDHGFLKRDRQLVDKVMADKIQRLKDYIELKPVQAAYQRMTSASEQASNDDCMTVWKAVILTLWLESVESRAITANG
ncbi:MAG: lasso peptide isopeptide bond-forming cyclase [Phormidesmis sp.]